MRKLFIVMMLVVVAAFPVYHQVVSHFYSDIANRGLFGDMFGGLNALFSGLAFLGVIYAIFLQKEELGLQRKELELTRKELQRAAEAQEMSQKELSKQAASLKATAKLNGLSALLQRYTLLRNDARSNGRSFDAMEWDRKAKVVTQEIEDIINPK